MSYLHRTITHDKDSEVWNVSTQHYKNREIFSVATELLKQFQDLKHNCQLVLFSTLSCGILLATAFTYFTIIIMTSPCLHDYTTPEVIFSCVCGGKLEIPLKSFKIYSNTVEF